jgi:hypothetical protein
MIVASADICDNQMRQVQVMSRGGCGGVVTLPVACRHQRRQVKAGLLPENHAKLVGR